MRNPKIEYNRTTENIEILVIDPISNKKLSVFKFKKTDINKNREAFRILKDKYDFIPEVSFPPKKVDIDRDLDWLS